MKPLVFGHDATVYQWASKQVGYDSPCRYAIGVVNDEGDLIGAFLLHNHEERDIELHFRGKFAIKRSHLRELCEFIFNHLKVLRVTFSIPRRDKAMIKKLMGLRFHYEGVRPFKYGPHKKDAAVLFGFYKSDIARLVGVGNAATKSA